MIWMCCSTDRLLILVSASGMSLISFLNMFQDGEARPLEEMEFPNIGPCKCDGKEDFRSCDDEYSNQG